MRGFRFREVERKWDAQNDHRTRNSNYDPDKRIIPGSADQKLDYYDPDKRIVPGSTTASTSEEKFDPDKMIVF